MTEGVAVAMPVSVRAAVPPVRPTAAAVAVSAHGAAFAGAPTAEAGQRLGDGVGGIDVVGGHRSILHAT